MFQYGSRFVTRQTADLHQLSGKHFLHSLALEKHAKITTGQTTHNASNWVAHLVFDGTVIELGKRNERAGRDARLLLLPNSVALQLSGAADQRLVLR